MPRKPWKVKLVKPASPTTSYDILQPAWSPLGNGLWESKELGRRLQLRPTSLINLSDVERRHLKLVAQYKLQQLGLGPVNIPRDLSELKKKKGGKLLKGGRNFFDNWREHKDAKDNYPLIFGIPLEKCLQNDQEMRQFEAHKSRERRESLDLAQPVRLQTRRRSSATLQSSQLPRKSSASSTALLEALSLSSTVNESHRRARRASLAPNVDLQIPRVVTACFRFIEAYGLRTEGIFRVSGSKKRVRQMRESYDKGDVDIFTGDQSPHDVGALLKEYFRDLPEPLLTRDLFNIFTSLTKFNAPEGKLSMMRFCVCLLPVMHGNILFVLMKFLARVADEAERDHDSHGNEVSGNKMDALNLGTLFGPNILRKTKGGLAPEKDKDFHNDVMAHIERTHEVILTVCFLIKHYKDIYQVPVSLQEEILQTISETDLDALNFILNQRSLDISFVEEPTQVEPTKNSKNVATSPVDTTSSSSGTYPWVIEDSSLASLSTIEDLVNENNFSDFDEHIPSRESSDSLDALEEEEEDTTVNYQDFTNIPLSNTCNHTSQSSGTTQERARDGIEGKTESNISNGPTDGRQVLVSRSANVNPRERTPNGVDSATDAATATMLDSGLSAVPVAHHQAMKRNSIGLLAETMMALGISPHSSGKTISTDERQDADVNSNKTEGVNISCQTCYTESEGHSYPGSPTSTSLPSHRDHTCSRSQDAQSSFSSSSMSGSTSSSNASLVYLDSQGSGVESKKKLPNYDEVLKIKELGVKNYVTVNSSKYFGPVPYTTQDTTSSDVDRVKGSMTAENQHGKTTHTGDRPIPPYTKIRRRDHVTRDKAFQNLTPTCNRTNKPQQDPRVPSLSSPLTSRRAIPTSPSGESPISTNASAPKVGCFSPVATPVSSTKTSPPRDAKSPVSSRKTVVASHRKPVLQTPERRESPLLAWENNDPKEMGTNLQEKRNEVASQVLLRDSPPKLSLYRNWNFLLNDEDGEFDGPETYV